MNIITQSCVLFLWMHILTFVKSQDCTLEQFINGRLYDSNFDTTDLAPSYPGGKQVRVSCNVGYSGFFKLICVEGKWQSRGTKCQPRSCGHPGDAQFADFQLEKGDDFVFGSQVVYTCHKGYQMVSRTNYRRCMAEGWDGVVPVCEAQQCPVIHVSNNVQVIGDPEEATYGNVIRFSCKSSTEVLEGPSELYCNEFGEWSGAAPLCTEATCKVPLIENGEVSEDVKEYKEHDVLHFQCNKGYKRIEDRPSKCTKFGSSAHWNPTPGCELVKCKLTLPPLEGTTYEPAFRNVFSPGDTLTVTCGERHWISYTWETSIVTTCKENGDWSIRPVCKEVTCPDRRDPLLSHWGAPYWRRDPITLGTEIRYSCKEGYKPTDGAYYARCTRNGWSPNPLCQAITCDRRDIPNAIINHPKDTYKFNERAYYVCEEGYEGRFTLTCGSTGWTGHSNCRAITCHRQDYPTAVISNYKHIYQFNEQAHYVCREGYEGSFSLTCGSTGWIGHSNCREIFCDRLNILNALITRNDRDKYRNNDRVRYVCKNDDEKEFAAVCKQGVWTEIQTCAECPKVTVVHGWMVSPDSEKLYYTCDEGYKLFSKGWWGEATCEDNAWTGLQQCIETSKCGQLPVIPNGEMTPEHTVYEEGESIPVTCKKGYTTQEHLTCHDGKWKLNGSSLKTVCTPTAQHCNPPPRVENAVVQTSFQKEYSSGSEVTYLCRTGYTMEGEATIRCNNGKWDKRNIKCTLSTVEQ